MRREKPYITFQNIEEFKECLTTWQKILRMEDWAITVKYSTTLNFGRMNYNKEYKEIIIEININDANWSELDIILNLLRASTDKVLCPSITDNSDFINYLRNVSQLFLTARYDIAKEDLAKYREGKY